MKSRKLNKTLSILVLSALACVLMILAIAQPGNPDLSYGTTGFYADTVPNTSNGERSAFLDGAVTDDGKLVSVGYFNRPDPNPLNPDRVSFYVQKLLANGTRDSSFGSGTICLVC